MIKNSKKCEKIKPYSLAILRILAGLLMFFHGYNKIGGFDGFITMTGLPVFLGVIVVAIEVLGGLMLIFGLFTKVSALLLVGVMFGATLIAHIIPNKSLNLLANGGELAFIYALVFLLIMFYGAGKLAIDNLISKE